MPEALTTIHGRRLGIAPLGNLVANGLEITGRVADATITVSAEGATVANQRDITIQLKDANGNNIATNEMVEIGVYLDATPTDFVATGGSTGIAIGADGKLLTIVAKKLFMAISKNNGSIKLTWTDTGTEAAYLGVRLYSGRVIMSTALTNA